MPPAFRTPIANQTNLRPFMHVVAFFVTWIGVPMIFMALWYALKFFGELVFTDSSAFQNLPYAVTHFGQALYSFIFFVGLSFVVTWAPAILGSVLVVFALKKGVGGWATSMIVGIVLGACTPMVLAQGKAANSSETVFIISVAIIGGFLGLVHWITLYKLAPSSFFETPSK